MNLRDHVRAVADRYRRRAAEQAYRPSRVAAATPVQHASTDDNLRWLQHAARRRGRWQA